MFASSRMFCLAGARSGVLMKKALTVRGRGTELWRNSAREFTGGGRSAAGRTFGVQSRKTFKEKLLSPTTGARKLKRNEFLGDVIGWLLC